MGGKGRSLGKGRVVRRHISTNELYTSKLNQLSNSCELEPARLASQIICTALDSPAFIHSLQRIYNSEGDLWVVAERNKDTNAITYRPERPSYTVRKTKPIKKDIYLNFRRDLRFAVSFTNDHDKKLNLLSRSCGCKKAELAALLLHFGLDSSDIVMQFQEKYNVYGHLWVTPFSRDGIVTYMRISSH